MISNMQVFYSYCLWASQLCRPCQVYPSELWPPWTWQERWICLQLQIFRSYTYMSVFSKHCSVCLLESEVFRSSCFKTLSFYTWSLSTIFFLLFTWTLLSFNIRFEVFDGDPYKSELQCNFFMLILYRHQILAISIFFFFKVLLSHQLSFRRRFW